MFKSKLIHLVPPILQDRVNLMLSESDSLIDQTSRENVAQQLEVVRDYCIQALGTYAKLKSLKAVTPVIKKREKI